MSATHSNNYNATTDVPAHSPRFLARNIDCYLDDDGPALDHTEHADENYEEFLEALKADANLTLGDVRNAAGNVVFVDAMDKAVLEELFLAGHLPVPDVTVVVAEAVPAEIPDFDPGLDKVRRDDSLAKRARDRRQHQRKIMLMQAGKALRDLGIPQRKLGKATLPEHSPTVKRCLRKPRLRAQLVHLLGADA